MSLSHFDEKSGVVPFKTEWGSWWQTVHEVHIEVNLPPNTRSKDVNVKIQTNHIECIVHKNTIFKVSDLFSNLRKFYYFFLLLQLNSYLCANSTSV